MQTAVRSFPRLLAVICAIAAPLALTDTAFAQSSNGSVRGTVRDQTGAVIPGAKLELTNRATNVTLRAESNEAGLYAFPSVIAGAYTITVSSSGMDTLQAALQVQVQVSTEYSPVLRAGSTETKITVSGEVAPLVVANSAALGHVLERQRVEQLPLNGRDIQQLLITVPGLEVNFAVANEVRSWGMISGAHQYILDGAVLEEPMWEEGTIIRPPGLETIQEFKVENNASSAKYTRMTSIIMSTKSGTNQLHGAIFETNRDNAYGKARSRTDFGTFPELHRHEYGGNLGGPVYIPKLYNGKNRTFFFWGYEGYRTDAPASFSGRVPTEAMRKGDFSGLVDSQGRRTVLYDPWTTDTNTWSRQPFAYGGKINVIDPSRESPLAKYLYDTAIQLPTFPDRNPLLEDNWFGSAPNNTNDYTITQRLDHRFSDKDTAYARFNYGGHARTYQSNCMPTRDQLACQANDTAVNTSGALNWVRTFSPTMFNEVMASFAHTWRDRFTGDGKTMYIDQFGLPNPFKVQAFPYIVSLGVGPDVRPYNHNKFVHDFVIVDDNVTKIKGRHELEFGVHLRWDHLNTLPQQVNNSRFDFDTSATALYDPASSRTSPLATEYTGNNAGNVFIGVANYQATLRKGMFFLRRPEHALYFQDNFKVTPRLTLNMGIRWQFSPFISEANGVTIPGFNKATHAIVLSQPLDKLYQMGITYPAIIKAYQNIGVKFETWQEAGQPQYGAKNSYKNWGPHLGIAYRHGDGPRSFIIRAGASKSYYNEGIWTWMDQSAANNPFTASFTRTLYLAAQSPDGISQYGMRSVPTIIAGKNSADAISLDNPQGITPGSTYNWFFSENMPTEYVWDWNVTIEKEIMANTMVRVGYVGNHSGNQMQAFSFNDATPSYIWYATTKEPVPTGQYANTATRPYDKTTYGTLDQYMQSAFSNYNGAQFVLERRYSKGFSYQLMYVLGNALRVGCCDNSGGYANAVTETNQFMPGIVPTDYQARNEFLNYRRDTSSPKHRVRWNWMVDLPFGKGKKFGGNATGVVNHLIGGWQLSGMGVLGSTWGQVTTNYWLSGAPLEYYGYNYPIQDCRTGTCYPGYLWYNGYIPSNKINSTDANGKPNGVMGVPSSYKPFAQPFIPWGSTTFPAIAGSVPAGTSIGTYWDTNTVWIQLNNGSIQRTTFNNGLNPYRNQFFPGPRQWSQDVSLYKRFKIREGVELRFNFDAFNVFNHPNNLATVDAAGVLATRSQANAARELQLAVRLSW